MATKISKLEERLKSTFAKVRKKERKKERKNNKAMNEKVEWEREKSKIKLLWLRSFFVEEEEEERKKEEEEENFSSPICEEFQIIASNKDITLDFKGGG